MVKVLRMPPPSSSSSSSSVGASLAAAGIPRKPPPSSPSAASSAAAAAARATAALLAVRTKASAASRTLRSDPSATATASEVSMSRTPPALAAFRMATRCPAVFPPVPPAPTVAELAKARRAQRSIRMPSRFTWAHAGQGGGAWIARQDGAPAVLGEGSSADLGERSYGWSVREEVKKTPSPWLWCVKRE